VAQLAPGKPTAALPHAPAPRLEPVRSEAKTSHVLGAKSAEDEWEEF
jgi:hypothetical protein